MASELRVDRIIPTGGVPTGGGGGIVQVKHAVQGSQITNTATSYVDLVSCQITPIVTGSKIYIVGNVNNYSNQVNNGDWTNSIYVKLSENSTRVAQYEHPGPKIQTEFCQVIPIHYLSDAKTAGTTYTYTIAAKNTSAGDTHYFSRSTDGAAAALNACRITLMEISA